MAELALQPVRHHLYLLKIPPPTHILKKELSTMQVIEAGNAVPLYLAGEAHGAKQLVTLAKYWMAMDIQEARKYVLILNIVLEVDS